MDKRFINVDFEELTVFSKIIENCEFKNVQFKNSSLGSKSIYKNCIFTDCRFVGNYSSLGNPTGYVDCTFTNCSFQGKMLLMGSLFEDGKLSGIMKDNILIDEKRFLSRPFKFENCDLGKVEFQNITFNGTRFFKSTKFPEKTIRLFNNKNDELIHIALLTVKDKDIEIKSSIEVIFHKELRSGFDPFIIDISFLDAFLKQESRSIFEEIVKEYEIDSGMKKYIN